MKNMNVRNKELTKVEEVINIINDMEIKNKLRLGVCMSSSSYTTLLYNKAHIHSIFDNKLKAIDREYRTSYVYMGKYTIVMFAMAKMMEMSKEEQNQVALYLVNNV